MQKIYFPSVFVSRRHLLNGKISTHVINPWFTLSSSIGKSEQPLDYFRFQKYSTLFFPMRSRKRDSVMLNVLLKWRTTQKHRWKLRPFTCHGEIVAAMHTLRPKRVISTEKCCSAPRQGKRLSLTLRPMLLSEGADWSKFLCCELLDVFKSFFGEITLIRLQSPRRSYL